MIYAEIKKVATGFATSAEQMDLSSVMVGELKFLRKLLGDFRLATEIDRLQVFIRGEGEDPAFAGNVIGLEDEIQADGIVATVLSIAMRFSDDERPEEFENARARLVGTFDKDGHWGHRVIALVEQEKEIMHRMEHDMTMGC